MPPGAASGQQVPGCRLRLHTGEVESSETSDAPLAVHRLGDRARTSAHSVARPPVALAHGFTQNQRCWGAFADALSAVSDVLAVDLPGHGASTHDEVDLPHAGRLLGEVTPDHVVVGYSMGGRIGLHSALEPTTSLRGLVVIGATAGLLDAADRVEREARDRQLADDLEADPPGFIDRWLALPMFSGLGSDVQFRQERLTNRIEGMAATLRHRGTGSQAPLHDRLGTVNVPVLTLAGEHDTKFRNEAHTLKDCLGDAAQVAVIGDAGHACHLEKPEQTGSAVLDWLQRRWG